MILFVAVGLWFSRMVTVKLQLDELLFASVAVQLTVVAPTGKSVPETGLQTAGTTPEQISAAGMLNVATVPPRFIVDMLRLGEQTINGGSVSTTVTTWLQSAVLPQSSVARHVRVAS